MSENIAPTNIIATSTTTQIEKGERQSQAPSRTPEQEYMPPSRTTEEEYLPSRTTEEEYRAPSRTTEEEYRGPSRTIEVERERAFQARTVQEGQPTGVQEVPQSRPVVQEPERKEDESIMEKLKHMTLGSRKKKYEEPRGVPSETTHVPSGFERKYDTFEILKDTDEEHQIIEILGEGYTDHKIALIPGMKTTGFYVRSWTEDASTRILHILCGANVLEMVLNQEKFIHGINKQNLYGVKIPKKSEHQEKKFIPAGYALCWEFTLESHDIEFILKESIQDDNDVVRHTIVCRHICQSGVKMQGKWEVTGDTTAILAWNNSYSRLTSKKLNFRTALVNL